MKHLFSSLTAIVLALVLVLSVSTAMATTVTYTLTCVTDSEGIDLGVPTEELPELIVTIDDEAMTCIYTTAEGDEDGVVEIVETSYDDEGKVYCYVLKVTLAEGEVVNMYLFADQLEIVDEQNEMYYLLLPVAVDAAEAA